MLRLNRIPNCTVPLSITNEHITKKPKASGILTCGHCRLVCNLSHFIQQLYHSFDIFLFSPSNSPIFTVLKNPTFNTLFLSNYFISYAAFSYIRRPIIGNMIAVIVQLYFVRIFLFMYKTQGR